MIDNTYCGDRHSPSNTHGFHTVKRDCRDPGKCETHSLGKPCLELPNIVPISLQDRTNIGHQRTIEYQLRDAPISPVWSDERLCREKNAVPAGMTWARCGVLGYAFYKALAVAASPATSAPLPIAGEAEQKAGT